jgi:hypothetical protein
MKTLYEASNAVEAHMLVDWLRQEGIEAHIHGEALQGAIGEIPAAGLVRLVVPEENHAAARASIERWERTQTDSPAVPHSPTRSSGTWRFLAGLLIGVGVTYAAYRAPASADGMDHNRDGLLDEKWTYSPNGSALKLEVDRNLDRKVDFTARYNERGVVESSESDDNFDGVFETRQRYRDGNVELAETDSDGDGYPDVRSLYTNGVLDSTEHVNPTSGRPWRVEYYKLGVLQMADIDDDRDGALDTRVRYTRQLEVLSKERLAK